MNNRSEILIVSSYPPRECGIATYSQDLVKAIKEKFSSSFSIKVCALENSNVKRDYPKEVKYIFNTKNSSDYIDIANKINNCEEIKLVFIQHEFGLFNGEYGEEILSFLYSLEKPVVINFHTVLPNGNEKIKQLVKNIASVSENLIVMTQNSAKILERDYQVPLEKITVIQHGTHLVPFADKNSIKANHNYQDKYILSTFGLLNSGKGIEVAIDAMPAIVEKFPNALYLILGKTHPEIVAKEGEKYREFLEERVSTLGLKNHVVFVNRYLSLKEILEYLQMSDIYLFTSKDPNQSVSGTFSYAMGCGCPVISTPIPHAKEMLVGDTGIIIDFNNSEQLSEAAINLLSNPEELHRMSLNALHKIRSTSWENSAISHSELFRKVIGNDLHLKFDMHDISLEHIKRLTTNAGIIQFSKINTPDLDSGYTLDDNARALIAVSKYYKQEKDASALLLIDTYLNFIKFCQQPDGSFFNYVDIKGNFHETQNNINLEDSVGRAVWALGEFISLGKHFHNHFTIRAENIFEKALTYIQKIESPRAIAFAIKGLYNYNKIKKNESINELIAAFANKLIDKYNLVSDYDWKWFEDSMTYANSVLPEALLYAYLSTGKRTYKLVAKHTFDFLLQTIFMDRKIKVISNKGWHKKGHTAGKYGEQPIDVAYTILSLDLFYEIFKEEEYLLKSETAFSWFNGNNHLFQIIYNPETGGCHDGLEEHNVNLNQGAESTICYLMARLAMEKYSTVSVDELSIENLLYLPLDADLVKLKIAG